ncbi:hypothetical protein HYFRA_00005711 [Hymenoscyphus fraxineus]|uniref:C6 transcription factor n=1 Tax=Hymenoscyphus fraxineus TaxID=746836 RepID=A0A9N9PRW8_9HELO|nr:hypothetical protein HYFRA_00005711 [Hymenoscyphus fraxineus]
MVSTRRTKEFPEQLDTPSKPNIRASTPSRSVATRKSKSAVPNSQWAHMATPTTLLWLFVSLPLVTWDTGYILLRPYSMPGGSLHWPIWSPYELYGQIDYVYGWKAFNEQNGFTAAQGTLNVIETAMYLYYLYVVLSHGQKTKVLGKKRPVGSRIVGELTVGGRQGAAAVLVGFSAAVMTLSKTVLYWANEYYSSFSNIGHNTAVDLFFIWIIPNGAWIILSTYMTYIMGSEILEGLSLAAGGASSPSDDEKSE